MHMFFQWGKNEHLSFEVLIIPNLTSSILESLKLNENEATWEQVIKWSLMGSCMKRVT